LKTTRHSNSNTKRAAEIYARRRHSHAFTLIELLAVLAIVAILIGMMLPQMPGKRKSPRIQCVYNLKNVGLAYRIYATDNGERFPWELSDHKYSPDPTTYTTALTNELSTPFVVQCPADTRKAVTNWTQFSRANMSYFISPDASQTLPQSFLAGDRNITNQFGALRPGLRSLPRTNGVAGWDQTIHKHQGNAAMADGSVQQLSSPRLREQLRNTGHTTKYIKLSIP
jgi:prepilin-type N-terminal cleavage/methylation domain-containing protein/prepilin-type processing-associated H-X9-DG protein